MINCNPETVSTDYDTTDRLYFEPLTFEDVMAVLEKERSAGADVACLVQFGGQTPLKLALPLQAAGVSILGTSPDSIDLAEDRRRFSDLLADLGIPQPASGTATSRADARAVAASIGFPVVVRPSYVLGGRGMAIVYDTATLDRYMAGAVDVSHERPGAHRQVPRGRVRVRRRLRGRRDGRGGPRRHHGAHRGGRHPLGRQLVRRAAVHGGRAAPATMREYTRRIARALNVVGLMNVQYAIKDETVYVLEVNPRASRTVPYLSKATGIPLAKVAARVMSGRTLAELGLTDDLSVAGVFVKTPVFPFVRFPGRGHDPRPRDEIHGRGDGRRREFRDRVREGAARGRPAAARAGTAFISVNNDDKPTALPVVRDLLALGFASSRRAGRPRTCARTAWPWTWCTRSTRAGRTSPTRS